MKGNFLAWVLLFYGGTLYGTQIGILPAVVTGDLPRKTSPRIVSDYPKEFALLSKDIIQNEFIASTVFIPSDSFQEELSEICLRNRLHYVLRDTFSFAPGQSPYVYTILQNCKTGAKSEKESRLSGYAVQSLESHYRGLFRFLPRKDRKIQFPSQFQMAIYVFLDAGGPFVYEKKNLEEWIFQPRAGENFIFLTFISQNREFRMTGEWKNKTEIPFRSSNTQDAVLSALNRFISGNEPGFDRHLQILLLSPSQILNPIPLMQIIDRARMNGRNTILVVPPFATLSEIQIYERIASSTQSDTLYPSIRQRLGLESGTIGTLMMYKGYLRWESDPTLKKIPIESRISPFAMPEELEAHLGGKAIQKGELESDLVLEMEKRIDRFKSPGSENRKKILVQAHGKASWVLLPEKVRYTVGESYILETIFYPDPHSASGVANFSASTYLHPSNYSYPVLLEYSFDEIGGILRKYKLESLKAFMPVTILEGN